MPFPENVSERRMRAGMLGGLIAAALLLLLGRLFYLQIVRGEDYAQLAQENMVRSEPIHALRGRIFDRTGSLLAGNRVGLNLSLEARHRTYRDPERLAAAVNEAAELLGKDPTELLARAERYRTMFEPMLLARDLEGAALAPFIERMQPIQGITIDQAPLRWNPLGETACHVLGHVGEVREEELDEVHYRRGMLVGRSGIERQYEALLRGIDGETYVEVDALGRKIDLVPELPPRPPEPGDDLFLSLDIRLQEVAEAALRRATGEGGAGAQVRGAVVALDPWTGEVLVCASAPGFNPNAFAHGLTPAQWAQINDTGHPLLNRVVQAAYPPASTFKVFTSLAALSEGILTPTTRFDPCYGEYRFGNRAFGCWKDEGHGAVNLLEAFAQSCDVYYYQIARMLGLRRLLECLGAFNLDDLTGIDIPQEREGLVPTLEWYRRRLGTEPPEGNALNLSIGQGEIVLTPLQLAAGIGAIVTDGVVRRPHVAIRAVKRAGDVIWERTEPEEIRTLPVTEAQRVMVRTLLERVVAGDQGTGRRARVPGFRIGGKTGTAQNPHGEDHALFVAVAPIDAPEIVVAVVVEEAGHGGSVAAPVAQAVLEAYLIPASAPLTEELPSPAGPESG